MGYLDADARLTRWFDGFDVNPFDAWIVDGAGHDRLYFSGYSDVASTLYEGAFYLY